MLLPFVGSLAFVAMGVLIVASGRGLLIGIASIAFFGGCAAVLVHRPLDEKPRLVIDDRGVLDSTLLVGVIAWEDILDAQPAKISGQPFVALRLRNDAKYTDRLGPVHQRLVQLNEAMGFEALNLSLSALDADSYTIAALIAREAEARRKPEVDPHRG